MNHDTGKRKPFLILGGVQVRRVAVWRRGSRSGECPYESALAMGNLPSIGRIDGVQRALGRAPKDFTDYARDTAATGIWSELK